MKSGEQILKEELEKIPHNAFIKLFYEVNKAKVIKIIETIQNEAFDEGYKEALKINR